MLEAMSAGCLVLGSDTPPIREFIEDGKNGLLVNFFDTDKIAARIEEALDNPKDMQKIRDNARQFILDNYNYKKLLPAHMSLMQDVANNQNPQNGGFFRPKESKE